MTVFSVSKTFWVLACGAILSTQSVPVEENTVQTELKPTPPQTGTPDDAQAWGLLGRYWGHVPGLNYGPEAGVYGSGKNYWTEEEFLYFPEKHHRTIAAISCTRKSKGGRLVGLQIALRVAAGPGSNYRTMWSWYRGWKPWTKWGAVTKTMTLDVDHGESISKVTYRTCEKHFQGVKIETDGKQWIECGNWDYVNVKDDKTCKNGGGGILEPPRGRKVIGMFGDAKTKGDEYGIRGLGLLTIPMDKFTAA
ncbi:protein of unknown function [Taphrina deformans PYCC 5710]|uniref:Uncharacterized protein n=1 Tax=Taphrina deformans (strain PYCC 5710 / ATCC 11124 / CBS 356.35 / IMI 108563 / JCM 9778 / NBRC 8474) TaxID=1097556 RepID=R4XG22_TAPDE|nr:protein of unknown function [Taphrina deformans PYCC 5710]|eukprot:CCG84612.1 protein of unknown function [Taphrina deformans PYCC 5710]